MTRYKSKTLATWIALAGGSFGLHRFYLHGWRDVVAWLHPWPALAGLAGIRRVIVFGQDDPASWLLLPLLGLMVAQGMLCAILYGLTPDETWDARHNPGLPERGTRWGPVLGVVAALMLGAGVLMATIAFGSQRYFEYFKDDGSPEQRGHDAGEGTLQSSRQAFNHPLREIDSRRTRAQSVTRMTSDERRRSKRSASRHEEHPWRPSLLSQASGRRSPGAASHRVAGTSTSTSAISSRRTTRRTRATAPS